MFLTITPNASLDRILFIDHFESTATMRTRKAIDAVGGKGFDISVALRGLGQETTAVGFLAGRNGNALKELLKKNGIQADLVPISGETRIAHVIIEDSLHCHSHITTSGYNVDAAGYDALLKRITAHLPAVVWAAAGGSLPAGMPVNAFCTFTQLSHRFNVSILLDVCGVAVEHALKARPDILKMNRDEFLETFHLKDCSFEQMLQTIVELQQRYSTTSLVITCGQDGIIASTPQSASITRGPVLEAVNAAGAGDAVSAGLIWRLSLGDDWNNALRWAAAAGSASVLTEATGELHLQTVEELYPQIIQTNL